MMKEQHKAMFIALRDGQFDGVVDEAIAAVSQRKSDMNVAAQKQPPKVPPPPPSEPGPQTIREAAPPLTLDLDTLADQAQSASFQPQADLPPPPANVLSARGGDPGTGRYRTVEEERERERSPASGRAKSKSERPPPSRKSERPPAKSERPPRSSSSPKSERPRPVREERVKRNDPRAEPPSEPKQPVAGKSARPGPSPNNAQPGAVRPAAIFGQARPQQSSIFGEDIISDKSLDEVILSYLAEDLEEGSK